MPRNRLAGARLGQRHSHIDRPVGFIFNGAVDPNFVIGIDLFVSQLTVTFRVLPLPALAPVTPSNSLALNPLPRAQSRRFL